MGLRGFHAWSCPHRDVGGVVYRSCGGPREVDAHEAPDRTPVILHFLRDRFVLRDWNPPLEASSLTITHVLVWLRVTRRTRMSHSHRCLLASPGLVGALSIPWDDTGAAGPAHEAGQALGAGRRLRHQVSRVSPRKVLNGFQGHVLFPHQQHHADAVGVVGIARIVEPRGGDRCLSPRR